jgi:hypothetical protein
MHSAPSRMFPYFYLGSDEFNILCRKEQRSRNEPGKFFRLSVRLSLHLVPVSRETANTWFNRYVFRIDRAGASTRVHQHLIFVR